MSKKEYNPISPIEEFGFGAAALKQEIETNKRNKGGVFRVIMLRVLFAIFYTVTLVLVMFHYISGLFARKKK